MIDKVKNHILKYIRKYISLAVAVVALPFVAFNSFAYTDTYPLYQASLKEIYGSFDINGTYQGPKEHTFPQGDDQIYWQSSNITVNNTTGLMMSFVAAAGESDRFYAFPVNTDLYNYYFVGDIGIQSSMTDFNFTGVDLYYGVMSDGFTMYSPHTITDVKITPYNGVHYKFGYSFTGKIESLDINSAISAVKLNWDLVNFVGQIRFNFGILCIEKSASCDVDSIITAIQQQNNLIENGNDETDDVVTDFNEVFEEFNTQLEEIETFETQFTDDFNAANETYLSELSQFAMPYGVINAGNWLSTSMQTIYDNSDDYKMLWLVPLLLGVPLVIFFFKRGDNSE